MKNDDTAIHHEPVAEGEHIGPGSERSFAAVMAGALIILSVLNWWHNGRAWPSLLSIAALFVVAGLWRPAALKPLNRLWFKFGLLLHAIVSPITMGLIFYGAVVPTAMMMRLFGKSTLQLKFEPERHTYWVARQPPGPTPDTMKDQF